MNKWLKQTKRRIKEELMQAMGAHERTEDPEFDLRVGRFVQLDADVRKVFEYMQLYFDCMNTVCAAGVALSESLVGLYAPVSGHESPLADKAQLFHKINEDINSIITPSMHGTFMERVIRPTGTFLSTLPEIHDKIEQRKEMLLDFDSYRSRLISERDPNSVNAQRIALKLEESARNLNEITVEITNRIAEIEDKRATLLDSEFAALLACQYHQYSQMTQLYSKLLPALPQSGSTLCLLAYYAQKSSTRSQTAQALANLELSPYVPRTQETRRYTMFEVQTASIASVSSNEKSPTSHTKASPPASTDSAMDASPHYLGVINPVSKSPPAIPPKPRGYLQLVTSDYESRSGQDFPQDSASVAVPSHIRITTPRQPALSPRDKRSMSAGREHESFLAQSGFDRFGDLRREHDQMRSTSDAPARLAKQSSFINPYFSPSIGPVEAFEEPPENDPQSTERTSGDSIEDLRSDREQPRAPSLSWSPSTAAEQFQQFQQFQLASSTSPPGSGVSSPFNRHGPVTASKISAIADKFGGVKGKTTRGTGQITSPSASSPTLSDTSTSAAHSVHSTSHPSTTRRSVVALHSYSSAGDDDLTFKAGDVIEVIAEHDSGWWEGEIGNQKGVFPITYVNLNS